MNHIDEDDGLIELAPREGESYLRTEDIFDTITENKSSLALILFSGIQYYTGQKFDMERITKFAKKNGVIVGWDLAHAIGNVKLHLHDWGVDFACWCSYKYLNSGAGGIGGIFIHDKYARNPPTHYTGWWSNNQETRFQMNKDLQMALGADSFRVSNPPPFLLAPNYESLKIFHEATMDRIVEKQRLLTGYLEYLIRHYFSRKNGQVFIDIITPTDLEQRGSQLSLVFSIDIHLVHEEIQNRGIICDLRRPNVMRIAPVPLYNSFEDVWRFIDVLRKAIKDITH